MRCHRPRSGSLWTGRPPVTGKSDTRRPPLETIPPPGSEPVFQNDPLPPRLPDAHDGAGTRTGHPSSDGTLPTPSRLDSSVRSLGTDRVTTRDLSQRSPGPTVRQDRWGRVGRVETPTTPSGVGFDPFEKTSVPPHVHPHGRDWEGPEVPSRCEDWCGSGVHESRQVTRLRTGLHGTQDPRTRSHRPPVSL